MQRGKKGLNGFILATFVGRFPSDGATSMAVKGLTGSGSVHCRDHFLAIFAMELGERNANIKFLLKKNSLCGSSLQSLFQIFEKWLKLFFFCSDCLCVGGPAGFFV